MPHPPETLPLPGVPDVTVMLRRSARARRMSLRVSRLDGRVTLSLPQAIGVDAAHAFLADKAPWVQRHLAVQPATVLPAPGVLLPVEGRPARIVAVSRGRARLVAGTIEVDAARPAPPQVAAVLKHAARDRLVRSCDAYAARVGRSYHRITLRDTRSRWGSCSSAGRLMFSWRLVMAPPEVLDYVAAHEVAHLRHMDHSRRFWALVGEICPGFEAHRRWLREEGTALHAVRFG